MFPTDDDDERARLTAAATILQERLTPELVDELRQIGLYVTDSDVLVSGAAIALGVSARVNRVAFTDRVLKPETVSIDAELEEMQAGMVADTYLDIRQQVANGQNPFRDDDDDD